jgi:hypothetical protein
MLSNQKVHDLAKSVFANPTSLNSLLIYMRSLHKMKAYCGCLCPFAHLLSGFQRIESFWANLILFLNMKLK